MNKVFLLFFLCISISALSQDRFQYIDNYKHIAISEMHRTGIPASIKLAQGILESNAGASSLAVKANNHFGIKCGNYWNGRTYHKKDDDRNHRGKLIKSCFRKFDSAEESYIAHSEFLQDPNKDYRYGFLFDLSRDDYKSWAKGLKKAGYATNPKYPRLLIDIIQRYQLDQYDNAWPEEQVIIASTDEVPDTEMDYSTVDIDPNEREDELDVVPSTKLRKKIYPVKYNNQVMCIKISERDWINSLVRQFDLKEKHIVKFNDDIESSNLPLNEGQLVYLQRKKSKNTGRQSYHIVKNGETMVSISQRYGIKLKSLYKRNKMKKGSEPMTGEKLVLKGKTKKSILLRNLEQNQKIVAPHKVTETSHGPKDNESRQVHYIEYTVLARDTLYGIARSHGITVDKLKKMNNLADNTIYPGQILKIQ